MFEHSLDLSFVLTVASIIHATWGVGVAIVVFTARVRLTKDIAYLTPSHYITQSSRIGRLYILVLILADSLTLLYRAASSCRTWLRWEVPNDAFCRHWRVIGRPGCRLSLSPLAHVLRSDGCTLSSDFWSLCKVLGCRRRRWALRCRAGQRWFVLFLFSIVVAYSGSVSFLTCRRQGGRRLFECEFGNTALLAR